MLRLLSILQFDFCISMSFPRSFFTFFIITKMKTIMKKKALYIFICLSLFWIATVSIRTTQLAAAHVVEKSNLYLFIPKQGLKQEVFETWVSKEVFSQVEISMRNIQNIFQKLIKSKDPEGNPYYIWELSIDFIANPDQNVYTEIYDRMKKKLEDHGNFSLLFLRSP